MTRYEFDQFCRSLPATTHVIQWGDASVWKVGDRIFAICSNWGAGEGPKISFKCSDLAFTILREQEGIIPAPYLARAKWVQLTRCGAMPDDDIRDYIRAAHGLISGKLPKKRREELGL